MTVTVDFMFWIVCICVCNQPKINKSSNCSFQTNRTGIWENAVSHSGLCKK